MLNNLHSLDANSSPSENSPIVGMSTNGRKSKISKGVNVELH